MGKWHEEIPASAVVALLPRLDDAAPPPAELPVAPRPPRGTRRLVLVLATLASLACLGGIVLLWRSNSPGVWFNLIFTVMLGFFGLGVLAATAAWNTTAAEEGQAKQAWRTTPIGPPRHGVVVDREVGIPSESGAVNRIALLVQVEHEQVAATWQSRGGSTILQSQVPGVGSRVRVWRSPAGPVVIEVADPSVVDTQGAF